MNPLPERPPNPALYRARWVLPINGPAIENGGVIVRGLSIDACGPFSELSQMLPREAWVDLGNVIVFPGLINCHTHLDNSALAGNPPRGTDEMTSWLGQHREKMSRLEEEQIRSAYAKHYSRLTEYGTLAVADITSLPYRKLPITDDPLWSLHFFEVLGFGRPRAEANYKAALENEKHGRSQVSGVWTRFGITAHGAHSVHKDTLSTIAQRCKRKGDIFSFHCSESEAEMELMHTGGGPFADLLKKWGVWDESWRPPGLSPVAYLHQLRALGTNSMAVHCVHVNDQDIELLAEAGASVCLCPRSNEWIGNGTAPAGKMLESGVELVLGTDGLGSVENLNLFEEMAACSRQNPEVAPEEILKMCTLNAARALRIDSILGSLEMNKLGRFLVYSGETGSQPEEALVNGIDMDKLHWAGGEIDMRA